MITLITIAVIVVLSLVVLGIALKIFSLAKTDTSFTQLAPMTGKMVKMGEDIVNILFNSENDGPERSKTDKKEGYYEAKTGEWKPGKKQSLGWLFDLTGRIFFGISPIYEIFKFDVSWGELSEGELLANGKQKPPSVTLKKECGCTTFKRVYPHAVMILGAEMAQEGAAGDEDTATTRIDAALLVGIQMNNVLNAVYKIPPQGIVFTQVNAALQGAFNDYVKGRKFGEFRAEDKLSQKPEPKKIPILNEKKEIVGYNTDLTDLGFVPHMLEKANSVLKELGIGMEVVVVELKYYDLTQSPENEALAESQTLLLIAQNKGEAEIALAEKELKALQLRGQGKASELRAIGEVIGHENLAAYANLQLVQGTELRVYGPTNVVPVVGVGDGDKK
jgi:hypothetical protein